MSRSANDRTAVEVGSDTSAPREHAIDVTIVLPAYNEQATLAGSVEEIAATMDPTGLDYEFLFVDDGSTDGTWSEILRLGRQRSNVRGLRHRGNRGKASALANGFAYSRGEVVAMVDADLQYEPEDVLRVIDRVYEGFDAVTARKTNRTDGMERKAASRFFNSTLRKATGIQLHDMNAGLKAFRYEAAQELIRYGYGELHRYFMVIVALKGFSVSEIEVESRPRTSGESRYGMERYLRGGLDFLTVLFLSGYIERPLHLFGAVGLAIGGLGTLAFGGGLVWTFLEGTSDGLLIGFSFAETAVLSGVLLFGVGLLAEMLNNLEHSSRTTARLADAWGVERRVGGDFMPPLVVRRHPRSAELLTICGVSTDEEYRRTACELDESAVLESSEAV
jgi:glycosyltransferase involved in cell wall biosynthesis